MPLALLERRSKTVIYCFVFVFILFFLSQVYRNHIIALFDLKYLGTARIRAESSTFGRDFEKIQNNDYYHLAKNVDHVDDVQLSSYDTVITLVTAISCEIETKFIIENIEYLMSLYSLSQVKAINSTISNEIFVSIDVSCANIFRNLIVDMLPKINNDIKFNVLLADNGDYIRIIYFLYNWENLYTLSMEDSQIHYYRLTYKNVSKIYKWFDMKLEGLDREMKVKKILLIRPGFQINDTKINQALDIFHNTSIAHFFQDSAQLREHIQQNIDEKNLTRSPPKTFEVFQPGRMVFPEEFKGKLKPSQSAAYRKWYRNNGIHYQKLPDIDRICTISRKSVENFKFLGMLYFDFAYITNSKHWKSTHDLMENDNHGELCFKYMVNGYIQRLLLKMDQITEFSDPSLIINAEYTH